MTITLSQTIEDARQAALEVLLHNMKGPIPGLASHGWLGISRALYAGPDDFDPRHCCFWESGVDRE